MVLGTDDTVGQKFRLCMDGDGKCVTIRELSLNVRRV